MNHIMLDLETLSAREDAAILSIGAVRFDLDNLEVGGTELYPFRNSKDWNYSPSFYRVIDIEDEDNHRGLRIDGSTVKWWMNQSDEARAVFKGDDGSLWSLETALSDFEDFVTAVDNSFIWGNGSTFDNMILRNAYRVKGLQYPGSHKKDICYRTIKTVFPLEHERRGTHHNALDDARYQAEKLIEIIRGIRSGKCASQV